MSRTTPIDFSLLSVRVWRDTVRSRFVALWRDVVDARAQWHSLSDTLTKAATSVANSTIESM
jgi:hypothetical protein